jgi:hypothetical protein
MQMFHSLCVVLDIYLLRINRAVQYVPCAASTAGMERRILRAGAGTGFRGGDIANASAPCDLLEYVRLG